MRKKLVYAAMCADLIHHGHINIIEKASRLGNVVVGLLTDKAIASYKNPPLLSYGQRKRVIENIKGVEKVIPQTTLDYIPNLLKLKPDYVVHSDGWKSGIQKATRERVIHILEKWGGKLMEIPHTEGISSTKLRDEKAKEIKQHPHGIIDPFLRVDIADNILNEFFRIVEQLKIKAFLVAGLCLGFVRDGGYIEGDNDLDIGVICNEDEKEKLVNSLKENSFSQGQSFRHNNIHFHKNKILVDIHFKESKGFYSNFDSIQYKGKAYPIPNPVEEYLSKCYSSWKIKEHQASHYHG